MGRLEGFSQLPLGNLNELESWLALRKFEERLWRAQLGPAGATAVPKNRGVSLRAHVTSSARILRARRATRLLCFALHLGGAP